VTVTPASDGRPKSLIETGKGAPDPHDVKIDNWN
jgi:hypothetical protein